MIMYVLIGLYKKIYWMLEVIKAKLKQKFLQELSFLIKSTDKLFFTVNVPNLFTTIFYLIQA